MIKSEKSDMKAKTTGPPASNQPNRRPTSTPFVGSEPVLNLKKFKFDYGDGNSGGKLIENLRHVAEHMGTMCTYGGEIQTTLEEQEKKKSPTPSHTPGVTTT